MKRKSEKYIYLGKEVEEMTSSGAKEKGQFS